MTFEPPFVMGQSYSRKEINRMLGGGNTRSGIVSVPRLNIVLIFAGSKTHNDIIVGNSVVYYGAGDQGDQKLSPFNSVLKNTLYNGNRVFLFEVKGKGINIYRSEVKLISEPEYFYDDVEKRHRFKFELKMI